MKKGTLSHWVEPGREIAVRVTPKAARNSITVEGDVLRITVTAVPEGGKATRAVTALLSSALGIAKSRLTLTRGATGRDKVFRVD